MTLVAAAGNQIHVYDSHIYMTNYTCIHMSWLFPPTVVIQNINQAPRYYTQDKSNEYVVPFATSNRCHPARFASIPHFILWGMPNKSNGAVWVGSGMYACASVVSTPYLTFVNRGCGDFWRRALTGIWVGPKRIALWACNYNNYTSCCMRKHYRYFN